RRARRRDRLRREVAPLPGCHEPPAPDGHLPGHAPRAAVSSAARGRGHAGAGCGSVTRPVTRGPAHPGGDAVPFRSSRGQRSPASVPDQSRRRRQDRRRVGDHTLAREPEPQARALREAGTRGAAATVLGLALLTFAPTRPARAADATAAPALRVVVLDPAGEVIVGARV